MHANCNRWHFLCRIFSSQEPRLSLAWFADCKYRAINPFVASTLENLVFALLSYPFDYIYEYTFLRYTSKRATKKFKGIYWRACAWSTALSPMYRHCTQYTFHGIEICFHLVTCFARACCVCIIFDFMRSHGSDGIFFFFGSIVAVIHKI